MEGFKRYHGAIIVDIFSLSMGFFLSIYFKNSYNFLVYFKKLLIPFFVFLIIWIITSIFFDKYKLLFQNKKFYSIIRIIICNSIALTFAATIMYLIRATHLPRTIVFGTLLISTFIEVSIQLLYIFLFKNIVELSNDDDNNNYYNTQQILSLPEKSIQKFKSTKTSLSIIRESKLFSKINKNVLEFISNYVDLHDKKSLFLETSSHFNIEMLSFSNFNSIVNFRRLNDIRFINKFFEAVNKKLTKGGIIIGVVETKDQRKKRILKKFPPIINYIYYFFDFIFKRVFPKFNLTKKFYFFITQGKNRVISKAETFGRLVSCGFKIIDDKEINGLLYFVAAKETDPLYPKEPTYGALVKLKRIGKNGKIIKVYKFRTMHPFAEFLQEYMYEKEGLDTGGKFKNDFRVTTLGRIMRKLWIDELPMLINLIKGDLKLVGVRPLSKQYFELYPKEVQNRRIKYKPGLIPPYYADLPKTLDEIISSEIKYFDQYDSNPFLTDIKYFFKAIYNIMLKKARSK